jgi:uncharacterized protein (TIGR01777 family)
MPTEFHNGGNARRVLIAGSSGMIGRPLATLLTQAGHAVHTLVRRAPKGPSEHQWNPVAGVINSGIIDHVDVVINLSGASIGKIPWTRKHKDLILSSRVSSTQTLAHAISTAQTPPSLLLQGSAVGFYGSRGDETLSEASSGGSGFLAHVVSEWENAALPARSASTRVAYARTGLVVGSGGAMAPLKLQTLLGVGGPIGPGTQWWPWISLRDEVRALAHLVLHDTDLEVFNLVGPEPATATDVTTELARALHRPHLIGLPTFAITTLMGEAGRELLLSSQKIVPKTLTVTGFTWRDDSVAHAVAQMLSGKN